MSRSIRSFEQMEALLRASSASTFALWKLSSIRVNAMMDGDCLIVSHTDFMENLGFDKLIVVLTRPKGYQKSHPNGVRNLQSSFYRKFPEFVQVASNRHIHHNKSIEKDWGFGKLGTLLCHLSRALRLVGRLEKDPENVRPSIKRDWNKCEWDVHLKTFLETTKRARLEHVL